jgi:hypothetical protein
MSRSEELAAIDREVGELACRIALNPQLRPALGARGRDLEARYLSLIEGLSPEQVPEGASEALADAQFVQADTDCVSLRLGHFMKANGLIPV